MRLSPEAKILRVVLFCLLALSAVCILFLEPMLGRAIEQGTLPHALTFVPLGVYGLFLLLYAFDRWILVRDRDYPSGRAFFQVSFGLVFGLLLLPSTLEDWTASRRARAAAVPAVVQVEAAGFRGPGEAELDIVLAAVRSDGPRRQAALRVLAAWSGRAEATASELVDWGIAQRGSRE